MDWARKIKELRYFEDLKQDVLARQLGVSQASVSQWERGVAEPPESAQRRLLRRLAQTPPERFLRALKQSVRSSPNVAFLMARRDGTVHIELVSEGLEARTDFLRADDVGRPLRGLFGEQVDAQLAELEKAGLFDGKLEGVQAMAMLTREGRSRPVQVSMIPFRIESADIDFVVRVEVRYPSLTVDNVQHVEPELIMLPHRRSELEPDF
ncbi:helix-turn-helix domain-containing protein [Maricaulis parjimensis]|uniref:helix-turn-helix domain-containing protein n=1 Tax=Maricaulis parjimensis TaxID=144023 RepID=UPI00193ABB5C|nr:helix-turn-helix domain-containing protein [Maricaulis parjimensis]